MIRMMDADGNEKCIGDLESVEFSEDGKTVTLKMTESHTVISFDTEDLTHDHFWLRAKFGMIFVRQWAEDQSGIDGDLVQVLEILDEWRQELVMEHVNRSI